MKRLLEMERLWFGLEIGTGVAAVLLSWVFGLMVLFLPAFAPAVLMMTALLWLCNLYGFMYLWYRLLYLWRGTPKRGMWTVFCLFTVLSNWIPEASLGSPLYFVSAGLTFASLVLSIACLVHDYAVITGAVEQHIPGEENTPSEENLPSGQKMPGEQEMGDGTADSGDGN